MKIALIVPVYNEKDNIIPFLEQAIAAVEKINISYEIIFVADPSEDGTVELILDRIKYNKNIKLIVMSRRFGQPAALLAGIKNTDADYAVLIDVDLQDPPELIPEMYQQAKLGFDVVMARRNKKIGENFIRKIISSIGYKIISKLSDTNIPENVGEFRLISKKIINNIRSMEERDFFLRGIISYIGFKQKIINFDRISRKQGETKYNKYFGSLRIGLNGIFSFSTKPLHFITMISFASFATSIVIFTSYLFLTYLGFFVFKYQFFTIILIFVVSSLIFFSQGIISEYLARLISDIKKRPSFIIDKKYNFSDEN
jgi:glycosyltransferase involved in cell wall biosynthesis